MGFPADSVVKNPPVNAGDTGDVGSIPGLGQSPGEGNGNPLQDSRLGNPMDRGAWQVTKELDTSMHTSIQQKAWAAWQLSTPSESSKPVRVP